MTDVREKVYGEWVAKTAARDEAEANRRNFTRLGDDIFRERYDNSFANYDDEVGDPEMDGHWRRADEESDKVAKLEREIDHCYKMLVSLVPSGFLSEYESCATVGHAVKVAVKVVFFGGEEAVGHIYPWEGDYTGPPYYLSCEGKTVYVGHGEFVKAVTRFSSFR